MKQFNVTFFVEEYLTREVTVTVEAYDESEAVDTAHSIIEPKHEQGRYNLNKNDLAEREIGHVRTVNSVKEY
ncbi:hypothetical protein G7062_10445 [Erysipelothrix sp. HDW6C]|uniref:hypothetical protein n=1 Tax=Erysipelothrix sp. HDW6C TaxID=2714930 RepID=UPI001408C855|nr:hypothetical protein [Erysipelothrix sp. HDW6C]QIK70696.1 hypothetical protein G7062_10445 [Erysipelothrix sp. HDW6C]